MSKMIQKAYRIENDFYNDVEKFLDSIGLTAPQAINMFFKRMMMEQQLPFTPGIVKSRARLEAEASILKLTEDLDFTTVNFDTGENVEEFFND